MSILKNILLLLRYVLLLPVVYFVLALILSGITVNKKSLPANKTVYLSTNGVHLDIILAKADIDSTLLKGINQKGDEHYFAFGWGNEHFYLNTPSWRELKFSSAFRALFLKSASLMYVTRLYKQKTNWVEVAINEQQLQKLTHYINQSFSTNKNEAKILLEREHYSASDNFYKANGSYSCFKTCNTWVNNGFKASGLKACLWTPFDFGLLTKYKP